jgi:hypothetical protein
MGCWWLCMLDLAFVSCNLFGIVFQSLLECVVFVVQ